MKIRYVEPPIDFTFHISYMPDLKKNGIFKAKMKAKSGSKDAVVVPGLNHTLWAGCRDNQTSQEANIGGAVRGVFTYNFCQVLRRTVGNISRRELDRIVTAAIKRAGFAQIPQLETSAPEMIDRPFR